MNMRDRTLTAHHEAGHAVASTMRGGSILGDILLTDGKTNHLGLTTFRAHAWDRAFVAYAGPWAQARYEWALTDADITGEDDMGLDFRDYVADAFLDGGREDAETIEQFPPTPPEALERLRADGVDAPSPEKVWCVELERVWPAISSVAVELLARGELHDADIWVRALLDVQDDPR